MKYSKKYEIFNAIQLKGETLLLCHILQFPISSSNLVIETNYSRISIKILMKSVKKKFIITSIRLNAYLTHTERLQKTNIVEYNSVWRLTFAFRVLLYIINYKESLTSQMSHSEALTASWKYTVFLPYKIPKCSSPKTSF